jgi:hypothetical protein
MDDHALVRQMLYGQYRKSPTMSFGAKLRLGSNFPIAGYFDERQSASFDSGLIAGLSRNTVRLPLYARLDLRADRTFNYSTRRLTLFAEVVNVLNRDNLARANGVVTLSGSAHDFTNAMFPLLPSAGIRIDF